jgi:hypothetical protein
LPPVTPKGFPYGDPGCVLRVELPEPRDPTNRTGYFVFTFRMKCIARDSDPCDRVQQRPTAAHPVTVEWKPAAKFWLVACGDAANINPDTDPDTGTCPPDPTPSPSTTTSASPSTTTTAPASP